MTITDSETRPLTPGAIATPAAGRRSRLRDIRDIAALGKLRLSSLVVVATGAGYLLAARAEGEAAFGLPLLAAVLGTGLVAAGANAFNQALEHRFDRHMERTRARPIAAGNLPPAAGHLVAALVAFAGLCILCGGTHSLAALLALASLGLYVLLYTPLKRWTVANTLVGAIPGALPPVIGWAAARGGLDAGALFLFAFLFAWQIPHFLAIAWIYRRQYAAAGFRMLPVRDPDGATTGRMALVYTVALAVLSLLAPFFALGGAIYLVVATVCGLCFAFAAFLFARERSRATARRLFFASLIYLPVLLALMVVDGASP